MDQRKNKQVYGLLALILVLGGSFAAISKLTLRDVDSFQVLMYMFGTAFAFQTIQLLAGEKMKAVFALQTIVTLLFIFLLLRKKSP